MVCTVTSGLVSKNMYSSFLQQTFVSIKTTYCFINIFSYTATAGIDFRPPMTLTWISGREWMDVTVISAVRANIASILHNDVCVCICIPCETKV